ARRVPPRGVTVAAHRITCAPGHVRRDDARDGRDARCLLTRAGRTPGGGTMTPAEHVAAAQAELTVALQHNATALAHLEAATHAPGVITDRTPRPLPALGPWAVGEVRADPTFGSRIGRVTGANTNPEAPGVSYRSSDSTIQ